MKTVGYATLLMLVSGTAGALLYNNIDWSKPVYYCDAKPELGPMYCNRFSSTGVTCYPNANNNTGSKTCTNGWTKIIQDTTITTTTILDKTKIYDCYPDGCVTR